MRKRGVFMGVDFNEVIEILKEHRREREKQAEYQDEDGKWYPLTGSESIEILTSFQLRIVVKKWSEYEWY